MVVLLRKAPSIVVASCVAVRRRRPRSIMTPGLAALALLAGACASGTPALQVSDAQAAVPLAGSSQLVLTVTNSGDGDDALVGVETDAALAIELHETRIADDRATMVSLDEVPLPAGETVRFRPGGLHLMMIAPSDEVVLGATFDVTLRFDRSDPVTTTAEVRELLDLAEDSFDDPDA
jgi:periplasmic copper chaperone A